MKSPIVMLQTCFSKSFQRSLVLISSTVAIYFCTFSTALSATIYVDVNVTSSIKNGNSWTTAYADLQRAIDAASIGDEIRVAEGTYYPSESPTGSTVDPRLRAFHLDKNIKLIGGWNPTTTKKESAASVLSGDLVTPGIASDSAYHVLITAGLSSNAVISNFAIVAGKGNNSGTYTFNSQTFVNQYGAGMSNEASSPTLENVVFTHNKALYGGAVMNRSGSNPRFKNAVFFSNTATYGSAISSFYSSNVVITNCNFFENKTDNNSFGAVHNESSCEATLYNTVFWGNKANSSNATLTGTKSPSSTHNAVDYRTADWPNTIIDLSSSTYNDIFKNSANASGADGKWGTSDDGFNLTATAVLAEAGSTSNGSSFDLSGVYRFEPPSIGAYEESLGEGFVPLKVSGFNHDVIAESGTDPALVTTTSMDNPKIDVRNAMYSKLFRYPSGTGTYGLPNDGKINSDANKGVNYQLQPYNENNALILDLAERDTLVLSSPGVFKSMAILAASTDGNSTFSVTCIYSDQTSKVVSFEVPDWYDGTNAAITGFGRVKVTTGVYEDDPVNPRLYDNILHLDPNKVVNKLVFAKNHSTSRSCIFAVCGLTPPGVPDWPRANPATNIVNGTGFTANWDKVDKADGYIIDVATDREFTKPISGYNNKSLGDISSLSVSTTETKVFYRIRAYNTAGQSINSNIITVKLGIDASDFVTISLSGFNADIIAEGTGKDASVVTNNTFDYPDPTRADYVLYSKEFRYGAGGGAYGLPNDGKILSTSNAGVKYQLNDYTKNNVLLLTGADTGELTLDLADVYDQLIILSASAEGSSSFNVIVTYSDGTTQNKIFTVDDWFSGPDPAIKGYGRIRRTTDEYEELGSENPRLYDSKLDVNATKRVTKLKFKKTNSTSRTGIFAVCGLTPAGVPKAPTAIEGTSNANCSGFTINWHVDPEVQGYVLDVARDSTFTDIVSDFSNKDMGKDTSLFISSPVNVYFRVRSVNNFGQSISSNVVKAQRHRTISNTIESLCDSMTWNGKRYYQTGLYEYLTVNAVGCDSAAQLDLTIRSSTSSSVTLTDCGVVEVNGKNYNATGIYEQTIQNQAGCDSVITVNANVTPSEVEAEFVIATQLITETDVSIVNISKNSPDSSKWFIPAAQGITILKDTVTELLIQFADTGVYDIGLKTYKDNCSNYTTKSIYVVKRTALDQVEGRSPFIRDFVCYPNPSDGNFTTKLVLSAKSEVRLRILDANTNAVVDDRKLSGEKSYEEPYALNLQLGVYIMILETPKGNQIKRLVIH